MVVRPIIWPIILSRQMLHMLLEPLWNKRHCVLPEMRAYSLTLHKQHHESEHAIVSDAHVGIPQADLGEVCGRNGLCCIRLKRGADQQINHIDDKHLRPAYTHAQITTTSPSTQYLKRGSQNRFSKQILENLCCMLSVMCIVTLVVTGSTLTH